MRGIRGIISLALLFVLAAGAMQAQEEVVIDFYFPSATANDAEGIFQRYAELFHAENPDITVNPVFTGSYTDTRNTILTELQGGGAGPDAAVMLSIDLYSFAEEGYIVPAQGFIDQMADGAAYVEGFFPALMLNSMDEAGHVWTIPFQRSTPILYYNADLLADAGYDSPPTNNAELVEIAQALTTDERDGLLVPVAGGFPIWMYQSFAIAYGLASAVGYSFYLNLALIWRWQPTLGIAAIYILAHYAIQFASSLFIALGIIESHFGNARPIVLPLNLLAAAVTTGAVTALFSGVMNGRLGLAGSSDRPFSGLIFLIIALLGAGLVAYFLYTVSENRQREAYGGGNGDADGFSD